MRWTAIPSMLQTSLNVRILQRWIIRMRGRRTGFEGLWGKGGYTLVGTAYLTAIRDRRPKMRVQRSIGRECNWRATKRLFCHPSVEHYIHPPGTLEQRTTAARIHTIEEEMDYDIHRGPGQLQSTYRQRFTAYLPPSSCLCYDAEIS